MIKQVLIGFALATIVILFLLWLITGGPREIATIARGIFTPTSSDFWSKFGTGDFRLPWQPESVRGPDISGIFSDTGNDEGKTSEQDLSDAEREYDELLKKAQEAKTFGEPSPYRGQVHLSQGDATASSPDVEYVTLEATYSNTTPINVSGWSIQSALTGVRGYIPRGANIFVLGAINEQSDIYLNPGASAVVTSGPSPLGTSLRENICTGYLDELQKFTPTLSRDCPPASEALAATPENLQAYGDACFDFVQTVPSCTIPQTPAAVSPSCHIFLLNNLSYNGCVTNYKHKNDFSRGSWRIFLNAYGELWRNSHDIIRLLDADGKTVDVVTY